MSLDRETVDRAIGATPVVGWYETFYRVWKGVPSPISDAIADRQVEQDIRAAGGTKADIDRYNQDVANLRREQAKTNPGIENLKKIGIAAGIGLALYFGTSLYLQFRSSK